MSRSLCYNCNARRGVAEYQNGKYCHGCSTFTPYKSILNVCKVEKNSKTSLSAVEETQDFPIKARQYLLQYGIITRYINKYHISWSSNYNRIVFKSPTSKYKWLRSLDKNTKNKWLLVGNKENELFYWDNFKTFNDLVIVEDQISAIRISEFKPCVALGGTNFSSHLLIPLFLKYGRLVVWLDGDTAGRVATEKFRKKFKLLKEIKILFTSKDPKCYTDTELQEILNA